MGSDSPAAVYLAVVALECAVMFGVSGMLFATTSFNSLGGIYASLGVTCTLGMLLFAMDSIISENKFQLLASQTAEALFTSFLLFEAIRNPTALGEAWTSTHWIFAGVKIAFQLVQLGLAFPVWRAFGFYTYKVAGANVLMRQMFDRYRIFLSLIKLGEAALTREGRNLIVGRASVANLTNLRLHVPLPVLYQLFSCADHASPSLPACCYPSLAYALPFESTYRL